MHCGPVASFGNLRNANTSRSRSAFQFQILPFQQGLPSVEGLSRQGWLRQFFPNGRKQTRASRVLVVVPWPNSSRNASRAHVQEQGVCESSALEVGDAERELLEEQRFYSGDQCTENSLQKRPYSKQNLQVEARLGSVLFCLCNRQEASSARSL